MKAWILFLSALALMACQLISLRIGIPPTETPIPPSPTATAVPTSAPTETPLPTPAPKEKLLPTNTSRPVATPKLPVAKVYGMPLNEAFKLLYAQGYSAEMDKDVAGSNIWGVYVYYWENTDYDQALVCLWGGKLTTDPVDEVDLWRYTLATVGTLDEKALKYYTKVLSTLGFTEADIDGIVGKARDLLTLAQQKKGEVIEDGYGGYRLTAQLTTEVNAWGYTYGSFVIRIYER